METARVSNVAPALTSKLFSALVPKSTARHIAEKFSHASREGSQCGG